MAHELEGKVAVITGGARGQGRSHAITLAKEGADIVIADICGPIDTVHYELATQEDMDETIRQVEALDRRIVGVKADVRNSADMVRVAETAVAEFGRIDILVAQAGIHTIRQNTYEISDVEWDTMIDVNLTGIWKACKAVIPYLVEGDGGSIVMTSSVDGLRASPSWGHYGAAKAGVQSLAKTLAMELARKNVRVNVVNPTGVNSPMADALFDEVPKVVGQWAYATDRANMMDVPLIEPVDISHAISFLISDKARYITGITLPVDAGYTTKH